jgi:hypothetical protein
MTLYDLTFERDGSIHELIVEREYTRAWFRTPERAPELAQVFDDLMQAVRRNEAARQARRDRQRVRTRRQRSKVLAPPTAPRVIQPSNTVHGAT